MQINITKVRAALIDAIEGVEPDDAGYREIFASLWPELHELRSMGCSIQQITTLLNQAGVPILPSRVWAYYDDLYVENFIVPAEKRLIECMNTYKDLTG